MRMMHTERPSYDEMLSSVMTNVGISRDPLPEHFVRVQRKQKRVNGSCTLQ
jgi:hypothetical protein